MHAQSASCNAGDLPWQSIEGHRKKTVPLNIQEFRKTLLNSLWRFFSKEPDRFFPNDQDDTAMVAVDFMPAAGRVDRQCSSGVMAKVVVLIAIEREDVLIAGMFVQRCAGTWLITKQGGLGAIRAGLVEPLDIDSGVKRAPSGLILQLMGPLEQVRQDNLGFGLLHLKAP